MGKAVGSQVLTVPSTAVVVERVSKVFHTRQGHVHALTDITFSVEEGYFTVIVGPSGCGKTTLLRILGGLEPNYEGSVRLLQADGRRSPFAMVFQEQSAFPWMSVRDNVAYGLALQGMRKRERYAIADEWIERVGLRQFEHAYPHQLSGGMKQRVSVARAFAVNPAILLMDEPFSALDEQTRTILQQEICRLCEEAQKTVVFITHSIDEAITIGDDVLIMTRRPGRVKERLTVPFARPRDVVGVRSSQEYGDLYRRIWRSIAEEFDAGAWRGGADALA